jgi:thiol-disulfide isomerase/thioredoxin
MVFGALALYVGPAAASAELGHPPPVCQGKPGGISESHRGRVVLIDFWASWCPPCRKAMPFLDDLRRDFHSQGFEVVGINVDEDSEDASRFLDRYPVSFPILYDPTGSCPSAFDIPAMPTSYLVDRDGRLRAIHTGHRDGDAERIRRQVIDLISE